MAERLPVGVAWNIKSPSLASLGLDPPNEIYGASIDQLNGQAACQGADSNGSSSQLLSNGSSTTSNRISGHNKHGNSDSVTKNGNITKESESCNETEWVEQDEFGVYITLTTLPGSVKDLKRVRFSRRRFSEKQAEQWWAENRARVYEQYNVRMVDKSSVGVRSVDLAQCLVNSIRECFGRGSQLLSNGSSTTSNRSSGHNKHGNSDSMTKNGNRTKESKSCNETEWVEQDEPGVYITLITLPGSVKDLKIVRFSRKRFSEKQAEQWWAENRARVYEQYNMRMVDKSSRCWECGLGSVTCGYVQSFVHGNCLF